MVSKGKDTVVVVPEGTIAGVKSSEIFTTPDLVAADRSLTARGTNVAKVWNVAKMRTPLAITVAVMTVAVIGLIIAMISMKRKAAAAAAGM